MARARGGHGSGARDDARALVLAEELGAQLTRLNGAAPKRSRAQVVDGCAEVLDEDVGEETWRGSPPL